MIPIRPFKRENALRYGAYYVSRLLPYPLLREGISAAIRGCVNVQQGAVKETPSTAVQAAVQTLHSVGMAPLGSLLDATQIDEVLAFLATAPVASGSSRSPVTAHSQGVSSAAYDLPTILACPHLLQTMNHPDLLQIAAGFLGCKPTLSGAGLRWSFADAEGNAASDVQRFHRDTEDWKVLRAFIYLTDVSADSGPHQFVLESHTTPGRFRLKPYTDQTIDAQFGRDKVLTVNGPRGTSFVANMLGVHRGMPPTAGPRLLFSFTYTMTPTPIYRYDPVKVPDSHLYDAYTNRLLVC